MRVLAVSSSYPRFPGDVIAPFIEEMAAGVAGKGWETHVLLPWHPLLATGERRGVTLHAYRFPPFDQWGRWGYASSMVADERLHWRALVVSPFATVSMLQAVRRLTSRLKPHLLHLHWVIPSGIAALVTKGTLPVVVSLHGSDLFLAERTRWGRAVARAAFMRARMITACSTALLEGALRLGAYQDRVRLLPYGVDHCAFRPGVTAPEGRRDFGLPGHAFVFLSVGRLVRKKGLHILVQAAAELRALTDKRFVVAIAGSGDLEGELRSRIHELNLHGTVQLLGSVDRLRLPDLYRSADAFVLPIVRDERGNMDGLPNVLLEAMATGLPVVASALSGALDAIEDGRTGLLVPAGDPAALGRAMAKLMDSPPEVRRMGSEARDVVLARFTWEKVSEQLVKIYEEAVGEPGREQL